jgi:cysteine desulfurase/selenocysteine lyase
MFADRAIAEPRTSFDPAVVRADFPLLSEEVNGRPLVYLDNAATSQKPAVVIERMRRYYEAENANVHRGVHTLSQTATDAYEGVRGIVARYLGVPDPAEIVFTRGTTESINLVAQSFARDVLQPGDEIVVTGMEHHSNIVPWQMAAEATGARLRVAPIDDCGELRYEAFERLLGPRTRLVAVVHVSNSLGTVNPVARIVADAHAMGIPVLVDGAQAVPHGPVNVPGVGADFYCFSGHKVFGPTGAGVLYGQMEWLERLPPWQGGGDMIAEVSFERTTFAEVPHKFEAGTPNIAGVVGMGTALEYASAIDWNGASAHEADLLRYAQDSLSEIPGLRLVGTAREKVSVVSFLVGELHPYDVGTILDRFGVAVRTGHHCTQPLMTRFGIPGTVRASFAMYNNRDDVDRLAEAVRAAHRMLT